MPKHSASFLVSRRDTTAPLLHLTPRESSPLLPQAVSPTGVPLAAFPFSKDNRFSLFTQTLQQFLMFSPFLSFFYFYRATFPFLTATLKRRILKKKKKEMKNVTGQKEASESLLPQNACPLCARKLILFGWSGEDCPGTYVLWYFSLLHLVQPPSSMGDKRQR